MSHLSPMLDSLIKEITARVTPDDIFKQEKASLLDEILRECPMFVIITHLPALSPFIVCRPGLEFLGMSPKDYQKLGNQFFFKIIHPDDYVVIQQSLQHFHTAPDEELLMACKVKAGKLGWRWVYSATRLLCGQNAANCDIITVFCDVESLFEYRIYDAKTHHIHSLPAADKRKLASLTERETEVLRLVSQEYENKKIAAKLHISELTVKTHRKNLLKKLGVKSSIGLVRYALLFNLLNDEGWKKGLQS